MSKGWEVETTIPVLGRETEGPPGFHAGFGALRGACCDCGWVLQVEWDPTQKSSKENQPVWNKSPSKLDFP